MEKILTNSQPDEPGSIDKETLKRLFESFDKEDKKRCSLFLANATERDAIQIIGVCMPLIEKQIRSLINRSIGSEKEINDIVQSVILEAIAELISKSKSNKFYKSDGYPCIDKSVADYLHGIAKIMLKHYLLECYAPQNQKNKIPNDDMVIDEDMQGLRTTISKFQKEKMPELTESEVDSVLYYKDIKAIIAKHCNYPKIYELYLEGYSSKEIAEKIATEKQITSSNVRKIIERYTKLLKNHLNKTVYLFFLFLHQFVLFIS